jgi:hypothetical protein
MPKLHSYQLRKMLAIIPRNLHHLPAWLLPQQQ